MSGHLFVLTGASGCGKTTLLNLLCGTPKNPDPLGIRAVRAPKYSERKERIQEDFPDDVTHVDRVELGDFDIAYVINNYRYGIRTSEIRKILEQNMNTFVVLSDFRVVRRLREEFGDQMSSLYISSAVDPARLKRIQSERQGFSPDEKQKAILHKHFSKLMSAARLGWWERVSSGVSIFEEDWLAYATDVRSTEIRAQKIRSIHIRYIENLRMFDHVILNYTEGKPEEMVKQACNIIDFANKEEENKHIQNPPIFVVAAASGAGKGSLMEMLHLIGRDRVKIVSKVSDRGPNDDDKVDGMIAIGKSKKSLPAWPEWWGDEMILTAKNGEIPKEYDLRWRFHNSDEIGFTGHQYAVSTNEINKNLRDGIPQIFVSNMQQFRRFRELWPHNVVFVYLHRLVSDHEHQQFQAEKWRDDPKKAEARVRERRRVHSDYIENIADFDHVLLNTSYKEDLFDQMLNIVEYYWLGA